MELIDISRAKAVYEQMDGHEELEGLKHAFALDLKDGSAYILYTDNEQEKVRRVSYFMLRSLSNDGHLARKPWHLL